MRLAALPMYDLPELRTVTDRWWAGLARALRAEGIADVPADLTRPVDPAAAWTSPDLLLAQTCGYPLVHALAGRVTYVATPCYRAPGCDGPCYSSAIVVRADSPWRTFAEARGAIAAINGPDSQSGCNVLRVMIAELAGPQPFFGGIRWTGAHRLSLAAVRTGTADLAAIDAVTLALITANAPDELHGVRVLCHSPMAPGLPLITRFDTTTAELERLRRALRHAFTDTSLAEVRAALLLHDVAVLPSDAHAAITAMRVRGENASATEFMAPGVDVAS